MQGYQLIKTKRYEASGRLCQEVLWFGEPAEFTYYGIYAALVWPTKESPAYFLIGGEETWDDEIFSPASGRGVVKILHEYEHEELSLERLFSRLTDAVTAHMADPTFLDMSHGDFYNSLLDYLDRKGLRSVNIDQAPYEDFVMRVSIVKDFDQAGDLVVDKGSPLYSELQGISRLDLQCDPNVETKFYRLNCLSYLLGAFQKFSPRRPLKLRGPGTERHPQGWMRF